PRAADGRLRHPAVLYAQAVGRVLDAAEAAGYDTAGRLLRRKLVVGRGEMIDAAETLPPRFNMAAYSIGRAAAARGGEPALIVVDDAKAARPAEVWTFAQLEEAVLRIARGLREAGLEPGARILIRLDNTSAYALLFFGAIAGGFVPLPTSAQLTEP